jgi:hypothetical protein
MWMVHPAGNRDTHRLRFRSVNGWVGRYPLHLEGVDVKTRINSYYQEVESSCSTVAMKHNNSYQTHDN